MRDCPPSACWPRAAHRRGAPGPGRQPLQPAGGDLYRRLQRRHPGIPLRRRRRLGERPAARGPYQQPLVPDLRPGPTHSVRGQRERTGRQGRYRRSRHVLPFRSDQRPPATDQPGPDPRRSSDLQQPQPRRSLPVRRQLLGTAGRFGGGTAGARGRLAGAGGAGGVAPGQQGASAPGFRSCALGGVLARRPVPVRPDLGADKVFVYRYARNRPNVRCRRPIRHSSRPARQRPAPSDLQRRRAFRLPDPGTERPGDGVRP